MPQKPIYMTPAPPPIGTNAKTLDELLQAIKDEYVYNTRNLLRTARKASMRAAKRQLDACTPQPPMTRTVEPNTGHYIRFTVEVFDANGAVVNRKAVSRQANLIPKVEGIPRYKDFNTIRKNYHVKDEEVLRYVPYFGETDDVDLTDAYKVEVRSVEEEELLEEHKILSRIVERYLEINNVTVEQVSRVISELSSSATKSKTDPVTVKIQRLKEQWDEKTDTLLEDVLDTLTNNTKTPLENQVSPSRGVKNVQEDPIETYRLLSCAICTTHDCCFHDLDRCEHLPDAIDDSTPYPENEPCSEECFLNQRDAEPKDLDPGIWTDEEIALLEACVRIQGKVDRISCLAAIGLGKPCDKVRLKLHAKNLLPVSATASAAATTTANAAVPNTTGTTTVSEQSRPSSSSRQSRSMSIESSTAAQPKAQPPHVHVHKKRKTAYSTKSSKSQSKTDYPADCNLSADNEKRSKFTPCDHEGPCGRGCSCVEEQVHCEKACVCPQDCPRRWRGCSCKRGGACGTWSCECYKWSRECDVDLCGSCHAAEILDPVNLAKERNGEIYEGGCANVSIQRGETKRTLMGRSTIAGWGLFAGEKVKAGQFLGEYKGEIIGNEESERRGLLYDKKGVSFLFTLNKDQVIDATRAANKFRFVNHSRKDPNCFAKISFVNGVHRIGMYAKTDLYPGQELFFDYGYNSKSTKFVPLEHQARSKDSKVRVKLAGRSTKTSKGPNRKLHSIQRVRRIDDEEDESNDDHDSESFEESEESE